MGLAMGLFLMLAGVATPPDAGAAEMSLRERLKGYVVAGHRGNGLRVDGNTLEGFEKAFASGAEIIETDLQVTSDGVPVICHGAKIRLEHGRGKGCIAEMTLEEVKACRVNGEFQVPTFEETLQWAAGRVVINAEFKTKAAIAPALALVKKYDAYEWTYFQTQADPERYRIARSIDSRVALLFKVIDETALDWVLSRNDDRLLVIAVDGRMCQPEVIGRLHGAGKLVSQDASDYGLTGEIFRVKCENVFAQGVDIAVTDHTCDCVASAAAWNAGTRKPMEYDPMYTAGIIATFSVVIGVVLAGYFFRYWKSPVLPFPVPVDSANAPIS